MAKRRTSGIQRRSRASDEALSRRLGSGRGSHLDWRLLAIGALVVIGAVVVLLVVVFGGGGSPGTGDGQQEPDAGRAHITEGTQGSGYTSVPATSGPHWSSADSPAQWGVYASAQPQERLLHNMEHGGIVIWYQPAQLDANGLTTLTAFVNQEVTTDRFKVVLSPWSGSDFKHPIAITSWGWLMYLDTADLDRIRSYTDTHYGDAPEPFGGPGKPGT